MNVSTYDTRSRIRNDRSLARSFWTASLACILILACGRARADLVQPAPTRTNSAQAAPDPNALRERLAKRVSVNFRKTPIEDVLRSIAEQAGIDIVMSPSVKGEVTVKLTDVTLEEALRSILEVNGCDYEVGRDIIRILARSEMAAVPERTTTRVFDITYADVAEVVKSIEKFKSETGSVADIQGTSHILVTDKEKNVQAMSEFISQVDHITPQVLVEVRIYDITSKDRLDLGIQWDAGSRTSYDSSTGAPDTSTRVDPFTKVGFNGTISKTQSTAATARLGWINSNIDIDMLLKAQQEKVDAKLLANPRILALDNETANIKIVSEIPYQELQESSLGGSIGATAFREVGVELQVTPHVAKRDRMVRLHLKPVFSVVTGTVQVAGIGVSYPQPVVDRREADTKLLVQHGQTVVLGGLRERQTTKQVNKIPLLGDLPILGYLFRFTGEEAVNSELLVFITPWIIDQPTMSEQEARSYKNTNLQSLETREEPAEGGGE
jgi:type IV pilus secretin PilQ/predicted competence protein